MHPSNTSAVLVQVHSSVEPGFYYYFMQAASRTAPSLDIYAALSRIWPVEESACAASYRVLQTVPPGLSRLQQSASCGSAARRHRRTCGRHQGRAPEKPNSNILYPFPPAPAQPHGLCRMLRYSPSYSLASVKETRLCNTGTLREERRRKNRLSARIPSSSSIVHSSQPTSFTHSSIPTPGRPKSEAQRSTHRSGSPAFSRAGRRSRNR